MRFPVGLVRMSRWARHPPSEKRVKLVLGVIVVCAALWGIEQIFGWPAWLTPTSVGGGRIGG